MKVDWFPLWLSLRVAALSTILTSAIGLWLVYLLTNREVRGRRVLEAIVTFPLLLPPTVLGYYLLVLLGQASPLGKFYEWVFGHPLLFTWQAAIVAAFIHSTPIFVKFARVPLENVSPIYQKAARALGASEWRIFWRISLPLVGRSLLAAVMIAFARSLGDFGMTIMIAGNVPHHTQTLSVAVYEAVEKGNGVLARILVLVISAIALAASYAAARLEPKRAAG